MALCSRDDIKCGETDKCGNKFHEVHLPTSAGGDLPEFGSARYRGLIPINVHELPAKMMLSCKDQVVNHLVIEYPAAQKQAFDALVTYVAPSMRTFPGAQIPNCR